MRHFWYFLITAGCLAILVSLFLVFSLRVKDNIHFTDPEQLSEPTVTIADPSLGPDTAKITLVNFGDYQCPACADLETSLVALREEYGDDLRIIWKDMPNTALHSEALTAAVAAQCADDQDKFWEYHEQLMLNQANLSSELYTTLAADLGLKDRAFSRCLEDQATLPLVQRGFEEGLALGITATPTIFVNNERYTGSMTTSDLRRLIDKTLLEL